MLLETVICGLLCLTCYLNSRQRTSFTSRLNDLVIEHEFIQRETQKLIRDTDRLILRKAHLEKRSDDFAIKSKKLDQELDQELERRNEFQRPVR